MRLWETLDMTGTSRRTRCVQFLVRQTSAAKASAVNCDAQAIEWLEVHGFGNIGKRCESTAKCDGTYQNVENEDHLRCTDCHAKKTKRCDFFAHYKSTKEAMTLLYTVVNRWRPQLIRDELGFRDRTRVTSMLKHAGRVAQFYGELDFKHSCGRINKLMVDETANGQAKASKGAKAARPTKHPVRWFLTMAAFEENNDGRRYL